MSALLPKPEMRGAPRHFRDVPVADILLVAGEGEFNSFRWQPQARKIGSRNGLSSEPASLHGFAIIRYRQHSTGNVPTIVPCRSERWSKMCEHEVLRAGALRHGAKITSQALAIEALRWKSTPAVRT
jgi:hypothetical protein